jgi:hypothetical protein
MPIVLAVYSYYCHSVILFGSVLKDGNAKYNEGRNNEHDPFYISITKD